MPLCCVAAAAHSRTWWRDFSFTLLKESPTHQRRNRSPANHEITCCWEKTGLDGQESTKNLQKASLQWITSWRTGVSVHSQMCFAMHWEAAVQERSPYSNCNTLKLVCCFAASGSSPALSPNLLENLNYQPLLGLRCSWVFQQDIHPSIIWKRLSFSGSRGNWSWSQLTLGRVHPR